jgi:hypothetical protein
LADEVEVVDAIEGVNEIVDNTVNTYLIDRFSVVID